MRVSQAGIVVLLGLLIISATSCSYYNKVIARKNVVDGVESFKSRKYAEAEELFKKAMDRAPDGSDEKQKAILFLARTLHSGYVANRTQTAKAEEALTLYQKVLEIDPKDQSSFKSVANLYEYLGGREADWNNWVTARTENANLPTEQRTEAYSMLAAKQSKCANEVTQAPEVKKKAEGKTDVQFTYVKPEKPEDLEKLRGCIQKGMELIGKALENETTRFKDKPMTIEEAKSVKIETLADVELRSLTEALRPFESARAFKTSLLVESSRLAEMEGKTEEKNKFKQESDAAREKYTEIVAITTSIKNEVEKRAKIARGEDANANANKAK